MSRVRNDTRNSPDADRAWKQALQSLLPDFLQFAHPTLHAAIDWSIAPAFLDKELQAITRQGRKGRRMVDLLAKVLRRDGQEQWVLVHVEIQGSRQDDFARRMFTYHARPIDRYDRPVVSIAVLSDGQAAWRPTNYAHDYWDCAVDFRFPVLKVLDWRDHEAELARIANPFAQVLLAQLAALTGRGHVETLAATQLAILRRLARAGYTYEQISAVLTFLDGVIALPEEIEARVQAQLAESEGTNMSQVMSRWEARVQQRGEQRGQQDMLLLQLEKQCGALPEQSKVQIENLTPERLANLGLALLQFSSLTDLTAWLATHSTAER